MTEDATPAAAEAPDGDDDDDAAIDAALAGVAEVVSATPAASTAGAAVEGTAAGAPAATPSGASTTGSTGTGAATATPVAVGDAVDLLARIHMFAGLQPAYLRRLAAVGSRERHETNDVIFAEGAVGDKMYLILSGAVRISRQVPGMGEEALAVLRAGNYFGEMSLVDDSPRSADAKAHETCELFVIRKEDLEDLLFVDRDLAYDLLWNFVRTLTSRLRETNDKMTFLAVTNRF